MEREQFLFLIDNYINGTASEADQLLVELYYEKLQTKGEVFVAPEKEELLKFAILEKIKAGLDEGDIEKVDKRGTRIVILSRLKWISAAAILIVVGMTLWFNQIQLKKAADNIDYASKILPGTNKAILILDDGSRIDLDKAGNGVIAKQTGLSIEKTGDGSLVYSKSNFKGDESDNRIKYLTVLTPKGGKYEITLSDGTKVWLNSASSMRYPSSFNGKERRIELKGEGYFEVSHDSSRPFIVSSDNQEVKVLGTHFNISAYDDDGYIKTTLLQGSVKVNATYLKPGQQATLIEKNIVVKEVDVQNAIDWKNGKFILKDDDLKTIMRKLSRWYDIEVEYSGNVDGLSFGGRVSRSKNLSEALEVLRLTGDVKFKVVGRRVTVMP
ncbi:FecR family protein [Pedobacter frigoris]|uniref:FecR family protein n=1 Tax=Pedobacter frigoris TaxID=2571272 RepID=UPI00293084D8|nr:FecR domain-containing protein [Pedobacter frigoris]